MIEAVENHMPEVIIVDEIGTEAEAGAARTIAERGVQLIGTAHGNTLDNLIMNPILSDLVGGVQTVTLSDEEARRRGTTKTVSERKAPPTFDILVEIVDRNEVIIHKDTAKAVDSLLRGYPLRGEKRKLSTDGQVEVQEAVPDNSPESQNWVQPAPHSTYSDTPGHAGPIRVYPHGVNREILERVMRELNLDLRITAKVEQADMVLALRSKAEDLGLKRLTRLTEAPLHMIKRNTSAEIRRLLQKVFNIVQGVEDDEVRAAVEEAESAVRRVIGEGVEVSLSPRKPPLRKMQHRMITGYGLLSQSVGTEPDRHLVIYPREPGE
jgi:hypothetical protein